MARRAGPQGGPVRYRVLHPPYCYRWAGFISIQVAIVWLVASALHPQSGDAGIQIQSGNPGPASALRAHDVGVSIDLVRRTAHTGRVVALTFDDGPSAAGRPEVLALLAKYHATATFCMVGSQAVRYPDLVREVVSAGMNLCDIRQSPRCPSCCRGSSSKGTDSMYRDNRVAALTAVISFVSSCRIIGEWGGEG